MMNTHVVMRDGRVLSRAEFLSLLNTYNCFLKDKTQQHLVFYERDGEVVFEGFLTISWGVRQPIRLKIQDDKQQPITSLLSPDPVSPVSPHGRKRGMTRWGEFEDLHQINETEETNKQHPAEETSNHTTGSYRSYESCTLRPTPTKQKTEVEEEQSNLIRCMSDASLVKRRVKRSPSQRERNRQHCFSINGHFYNYKTAIFTPTYGTSTNVRINSKMTTHQVISQLLQKFKIENDPNEFALYCVHQSGEKKKLSDSDLPLWERLVQGPAETIMKMFLMDRDEEEVSNDVAQYLNLELPILEGVLVKLEEEENRAVQRITTKYNQQQIVLSQLLSSKITKTETEV
ncbi:ras association domain-containing protein 6 isoform X1 [Oncorhynchus mykiss]|uniref:ras association domain-containing protein 6 isoform X1 n=1 Tax=Oncorhynchus mykiss TaxID=8022 RepID=UPI000B4FB065|nr:ras association domain-containing protein 6 isoform X1 [Oncorhynchus mykiss]XP_036832510.1 ras association domain-containing protein 6 isoform X1 [Oncorhynchus mykiss]